MAPHTPPQQAQSSLVGGVCCDGSMVDMAVFRCSGSWAHSSLIPVLYHLQYLITSTEVTCMVDDMTVV